jgi:hypothetical protein
VFSPEIDFVGVNETGRVVARASLLKRGVHCATTSVFFFMELGQRCWADFHPIGSAKALGPHWPSDSGRPRLECLLWRRSPRYAGVISPLASRSRRSAASCVCRARLCGRSFARTRRSSIRNARGSRFLRSGRGGRDCNRCWRRTRASPSVNG